MTRTVAELYAEWNALPQYGGARMTEEKKPMTVAELREKLAELPDDLIILSEGCDCIDVAVDARVEGDAVLIARSA